MAHNGILTHAMIKALVDDQHIVLQSPLDADQIQPASLDLRLGEKAYRIRASFLPGPDHRVSDRLEKLTLHEFDLRQGAVLETGCVYLVPLLESLALPDNLEASANPKSSTGRLDVFTRIITDYGQSFDQVAKGYRGQLYLEIAPRTFPVLVRVGSRLSQIRFRQGFTRLDDTALYDLHQKERLVEGAQPRFADGVCVCVDLKGQADNAVIGYRAKRHTSVIDMDKRGVCNKADFWEPLSCPQDGTLILDPNEFYILASQEAVHIPSDYAAEMVAFDPLVGEFRVHYAGFFDPGFGAAQAGGKGARAVLEVRSREVPFILEHGQTVGRLVYERMAQTPDLVYGDALGSHYQAQGLKLSKHFK